MCHLILKTCLESNSNKHDSGFVPKGDVLHDKKQNIKTVTDGPKTDFLK